MIELLCTDYNKKATSIHYYFGNAVLAAERALKNFAIGRRNWLFAKSIRGAQASATVYSITETALLNGLKPYNYLTYVMEKMKELGAFPAKEEMLELLPWSSNLPDDCHSKLKK